MTIKEGRLRMCLADNSGNNLRTWDDNLTRPFQIVSTTVVNTPTGCPTMRVKARFSNVFFHLYNCPVSYSVKEAEFVMDFRLR